MVQFSGNMTSTTSDAYTFRHSNSYMPMSETSAYNSTSTSYSHSQSYDYDSRNSTVCKKAVLKKVKTNKNKFFVLHKSSTANPARLEYYDTESHWNKHKKPKRTIHLKSCFNITAYTDARVKYGLTLYTQNDSFQIGFPAEQERDMWLADMCYLVRTSCDEAREPIELEWQVSVSTRNMNCPFCGRYTLILNENQATLMKKSDPDGALIFPWEVIIKCDKKDKYFIMEVNEVSSTGAGEILLECDDALIAQNVHTAFTQNMSNTGGFRPVSKSLSYKDRKSAFSLRFRSGSDAKLRPGSGILGKMGLKHSSVMSSANSIGYHRERSDSVDSHSTTCSHSTEDSEYCRNSGSRAVTPDLRFASSLTKSRGSFHSSRCSSVDQAYTDMSFGGCHRSQDGNSNFVYIDMTPGILSHNIPEINRSACTNGYLDMTCGRSTSPSPKSFLFRPEKAQSYLVDDEENGSKSPSPSMRRLPNDDYVEMCRKNLNEKDKSSSAPHLSPLVLSQHSQQDNHSRTSSFSSSHRPRGSTWSQNTRPQHVAAHRLRSNSAKFKPKTTCSDYIDMTCGEASINCYVEMTLNRTKEDKENCLPQSIASSQHYPMLSEPFPELSASSEDDVSLHSVEGSMSVNSFTSSADSMSTSSHSSHYGGVEAAEPYVAMHPSVLSMVKHSSVTRQLLKPPRMQSFIIEDNADEKDC